MTAAAKQDVQIIEPSSNALTPADMLSQALDRGASIEIVEKMMGLQERWEKNNARKQFNDAIAAAKAEIKPIVRDKKGHNDKRYVSFDAIARAVDPVLSKHNLIYRFRSDQVDGRISVTCILSHGIHQEETTLCGPADTSGSKNSIQAIGSTLTYLQRYSLVQMLGLAAADSDDDGKAGAAGDKINEKQATEIIDLLEVANADRAKFLRWAKVDCVEDIPAAQFASCVEAIKRVTK